MNKNDVARENYIHVRNSETDEVWIVGESRWKKDRKSGAEPVMMKMTQDEIDAYMDNGVVQEPEIETMDTIVMNVSEEKIEEPVMETKAAPKRRKNTNRSALTKK